MVGGARSRGDSAGASDARRRRASRSPGSSTVSSCSTPPVRRRAPREAVERHRVGARRRVVGQAARADRRHGRTRAARCRSRRSRSRSCRGCTAPNPTRGRAWHGCACRTTGSPCSSPARSSPIVVTRPAPATSTRPRTATATTCSRSSTATSTGQPRLPRVLGPTETAGTTDAFGRRRSSRREPATTWPPRSASALRPGDVVVSIGTSGTVFAVSDTPTADATGAVAGFADATGRFLPLVCTLNATKVTDAIARLLGVDHAGLDALGARGRGRRRWRRARAVLRR